MYYSFQPRTALIANLRWMRKATLVSICTIFSIGQHASAQGLLEDTFLLDVSLGSSRSQIARNLSIGGYELSDGTPIYFSDWYTARFPDVNFLFLTQVDTSLGWVWGFGLGEQGEKYRIYPGFWIGLIYRHQISSHSSLTLSAITLLGGDFRERVCVGDYGEIGGIQQVNCRLAASILPPAETLQFLVNERGYRETRLSLRYEIRF